MASTQVTWHKASGGRYVVCGPEEDMRVGMMQVRTIRTGQVREVYVHKLGKVFEADGVRQRYGYVRR